jgi:hypothetical protein
MHFRHWHPEFFQGGRKKHRYFEGYYAKHVTRDLSESWSFIFALSLGEDRAKASSIAQVIEGSTGRTWFYEGEAEDFEASPSRFHVRLGKTLLSYEGLSLDLDLGGQSFKGEIGYTSPTRFPLRLLSPGVMGPYSFLPFMECCHGLVSLDHALTGGFSLGGRRIDFEGGRGYLEKDWGSSMPEAWIWTQSNNFAEPGDSFMFSLATIPWLGSSFPGFLCVASLGGRLVREASYTGARIEGLVVEEARVKLSIVNGQDRYEIDIIRSLTGNLKAPVRGSMSREITECVDALLRLRWTRRGRLVFEGEAPKAGLEIAGDSATLVPRN